MTVFRETQKKLSWDWKPKKIFKSVLKALKGFSTAKKKVSEVWKSS
jgi:hypothetical protein